MFYQVKDNNTHQRWAQSSVTSSRNFFMSFRILLSYQFSCLPEPLSRIYICMYVCVCACVCVCVCVCGFPGGSDSKESACLQCRRPGLDPWVGKIPWKRAWQPTPVFLPAESPWTEEPGGLQSMVWAKTRTLSTEQNNIYTCVCVCVCVCVYVHGLLEDRDHGHSILESTCKRRNLSC